MGSGKLYFIFNENTFPNAADQPLVGIRRN
jgi:hypothetical protein